MDEADFLEGFARAVEDWPDAYLRICVRVYSERYKHPGDDRPGDYAEAVRLVPPVAD